MTPKDSPGLRFAPLAGSSRKTTSPSCACAKSLIPIVALSPSMTIHSCDAVYFRSATTPLLVAVLGRGRRLDRPAIDGQCNDLRLAGPAPDVDLNAVSRTALARLQGGHRHPLVEEEGPGATGDPPDRSAVAQDRAVVARNRLVSGRQPDHAAPRPGGFDGGQRFGT